MTAPDATAIDLAISLAMRAFVAGYALGALVTAGLVLIVWHGRREVRRLHLGTRKEAASHA